MYTLDMKKKPRLSMKLLWSLREDFIDIYKGKMKSDARSCTKAFLWEVEDFMKSFSVKQP